MNNPLKDTFLNTDTSEKCEQWTEHKPGSPSGLNYARFLQAVITFAVVVINKTLLKQVQTHLSQNSFSNNGIHVFVKLKKNILNFLQIDNIKKGGN